MECLGAKRKGGKEQEGRKENGSGRMWKGREGTSVGHVSAEWDVEDRAGLEDRGEKEV